MSAFDRSERFLVELPEILTDIASPRVPDYVDDLLAQTAATRQRPRWTFLERWLPMVDIARQPVLASRLPWRGIGLVLVLLALIAVLVAALAVGGPRKLPLAFGPARNGLVAYASGGDIYTVTRTAPNQQWGNRLPFMPAEMRSSSAASHHVRVLPILMPMAPMRRGSTSASVRSGSPRRSCSSSTGTTGTAPRWLCA